MKQYPSVTVVVCVRDDPRIVQCIDSLLNQSYPSHRYSIVVVDNASRIPVTSLLPDNKRITILHEPVVGIGCALKCGCDKVTSDIITFTDADCIVDKDWIRNGVVDFVNDFAVGVVGGAVRFVRKRSRYTVWEIYDMHTFLRQRECISRGMAVGANLFMRNSSLKKIGGIDIKYVSGWEYDIVSRIISQGHKVRYNPLAVVYHPTRSTCAEIVHKVRRIVDGEIISKGNSLQVLFKGIKADIKQILQIPRLLNSRYKPVFRTKKMYMVLFYIAVVRILERIRFYLFRNPVT